MNLGARAEPAGSDDMDWNLYATVPTGLEQAAASECKEVLKREARAHRGRISFQIHSLEELHKVDRLRSVDSYHVVVKELPNFCSDEATVLERLESLPFDGTLNWEAGLALWRYYNENVYRRPETGLSHESKEPNPGNPKLDLPADPNTMESRLESGISGEEVLPSELGVAPGSSDSPLVDQFSSQLTLPAQPGSPPCPPESPSHDCKSSGDPKPTFRVTCTRRGRKHTFSSMDAARQFGAGIGRYFGWKVKLKEPDIEVLLSILGDCATIGIALSKEGLYKRNITHFGPTTLRSTIAYGLLRLANIQAGDVVLDPMCGGGSVSIEASRLWASYQLAPRLPILYPDKGSLQTRLLDLHVGIYPQGALAWESTFHMAGDMHELAVPRAQANLQAVDAERQGEGRGDLMVDILRWDSTRLPLKSSSVDVVVTDMPFGKKSGSRMANWDVYPHTLEELGRVCVPTTGRAVLLTHDTKVMGQALRLSKLWHRHKTLWVNVGGLVAGAYILHRTGVAMTTAPPSQTGDT